MFLFPISGSCECGFNIFLFLFFLIDFPAPALFQILGSYKCGFNNYFKLKKKKKKRTKINFPVLLFSQIAGTYECEFYIIFLIFKTKQNKTKQKNTIRKPKSGVTF